MRNRSLKLHLKQEQVTELPCAGLCSIIDPVKLRTSTFYWANTHTHKHRAESADTSGWRQSAEAAEAAKAHSFVWPACPPPTMHPPAVYIGVSNFFSVTLCVWSLARFGQHQVGKDVAVLWKGEWPTVIFLFWVWRLNYFQNLFSPERKLCYELEIKLESVKKHFILPEFKLRDFWL